MGRNGRKRTDPDARGRERAGRKARRENEILSTVVLTAAGYEIAVLWMIWKAGGQIWTWFAAMGILAAELVWVLSWGGKRATERAERENRNFKIAFAAEIALGAATVWTNWRILLEIWAAAVLVGVLFAAFGWLISQRFRGLG